MSQRRLIKAVSCNRKRDEGGSPIFVIVKFELDYAVKQTPSQLVKKFPVLD